MFVYAALLALAGTVPAAAARLYVPVVGATASDGRAMATEIWVANGSHAKTAVAARFEGAGEAKRFEVEPGGRMLDRMAGADTIGLVAVDGDVASVSAWIPDRWGRSVSEVPVIGPQDSYEPGAEPGLALARGYDRLLVGAANLGDDTASCQATLFAEDDRELARISFEVAAKSLARQDVTAALGGERATFAQVGCDRTFYPVGVTASDAGGDTSVIVAKGIGPNGTCQKWATLAATDPKTYSTSVPNNFHQATRANPKGIVCIKSPVPELRVGKATYEWDVSVGPWSGRNKSGVHNLGYFFRDRYRSGVIGNVNFLGPNKDLAKWMQNYNMPAGSSTNGKGGFHAERVVYHVVYTFDAANKTATLLIQNSARQTLQTVTGKTAPGNGQTLILKPFGQGGLAGLTAIAEFGNYVGQHPPEEATIDWVYANFSLVLNLK
jgi:hypothetical protein